MKVLLVLGFERLQKNTFVLDVLLRKEEGKYRLVLPELDGSTLDVREMDFIDVESYKEKGYENEKVDFSFYKINSEGRIYGVMDLSKVRPNVMFRLVKEEKHDFIARVKIIPYVVGYEKNEEVPSVFKTEDGRLDVEYLEDVTLMKKVVNVEQVTGLSAEEFNDWDNLREQVKEGLNLELIKEAGDCEIALAAIKEGKKL